MTSARAHVGHLEQCLTSLKTTALVSRYNGLFARNLADRPVLPRATPRLYETVPRPWGMAPELGPDAGLDSLRHIPLSYNNADSQSSALRLVLTLFPGWEHTEGKVEFIRFKDGITNTVRHK